MTDEVPPPAPLDWYAMLLSMAFGVIGRFYELARKDLRPLGWSALWEIVLGLPLGLVGWGLASLMGWSGHSPAGVMLIVLVAIGGTRVIDALIEIVLTRIKIIRRSSGSD